MHMHTAALRQERKRDIFFKLFRDCQHWIEQNMTNSSVKSFFGSSAASRMIGYLVNSPPFEKMTLFDILRCDRRTMYMLTFLSQIKRFGFLNIILTNSDYFFKKSRHTTLYCYNMLRDEVSLESSLDSVATEGIRDILEKGFVCAHILGIAESSAGAEDLPMISKLKNCIKISDASIAIKDALIPIVESRSALSPINIDLKCWQDHDPVDHCAPSSLNFPSIEIINEMRECLLELRNSMLRELVQDLSPKFFASKEFEILLWELNEYREQILSPTMSTNILGRRYSIDGDDDDSIDSGGDLKSLDSGGVVPNGAIQRLLRKMSMPDNMTMHRAPLELLEEFRNIRLSATSDRPSGPLCWLSSFDTDFSSFSTDDITKLSLKKHFGPKLFLHSPLPIQACNESASTNAKSVSSVIPSSITEFFVPSGKIVWEENCGSVTFSNQSSSKTMQAPRLFNFTLSGGGDVGLLYVAVIVVHRPLISAEQETWAAIIDTLSSLEAMPSPISALRSPILSPGLDFGTAQGLTPPPPQSTTNHKIHINNSQTTQTPVISTPLEKEAPNAGASGSNLTLNQLKGKVDKLTSSPFFDKFKGITPPAIFRGQSTFVSNGINSSAKPLEVSKLEDKDVAQISELPVSDTALVTADEALVVPVSTEVPQNNSDEIVQAVSLNIHYDDDVVMKGIVSSSTFAPAVNPSVSEEAVSLFFKQTEQVSYNESDISILESKGINGISQSASFIDKHFPERFAACGYCIVSKHPSVDTLRKALYDTLKSSLGGDGALVSLFKNGVIVNPELDPSSLVSDGVQAGAFDLFKTFVSESDKRDPVELRSGGAVDFDPNPILHSMNPKNLVALYFALMLEQKIAVISSKLTALTCLGEFLRECLAPFHWNHVYVPVLPKKMSAQILECPTPFFVGIQRDFFDAKAVPSDVCVLDLDNDACRMSPELTKALKSGRRIIRSLDNILRPAFVTCDALNPHAFGAPFSQSEVSLSSGVASKVVSLLKSFSWEVLLGIHECGMSSVDHDEVVVLFDEAMFLAFKRRRASCSLLPADDAFLKPLLRTQAFSVAATTAVLKRLDTGSRPSSRNQSPFVTVTRSRSISGGSHSVQDIISPIMSPLVAT